MTGQNPGDPFFALGLIQGKTDNILPVTSNHQYLTTLKNL